MRKLPKRLQGLNRPEGRLWLVMVECGWARDADLMTAATKACRYGVGRATPARGGMIVFHAHPESTVEGLGSIEYPVGDTDEETAANRPIEVARFER